MVFETIGVAIMNNLAKLCDHCCFVIGTGGFECRGEPTAITKSNEEDTSTVGIKRGGFQIELKAMQILKSEPQKIDPAGLHEVLFDGTNLIIALREFTQALELAPKSPGCSFQ